MGGTAFCDQQHRYIKCGDGSQELNDHKNDLYEWNNMAADIEFQPTLKMMAGQLARNYTPSGKAL
jgi:hypothetical protein